MGGQMIREWWRRWFEGSGRGTTASRQARHAVNTGDDLSDAVLMVIGFGSRSSPTRDYAVLEKTFGEDRARILAGQVQALLGEVDGIQVDWGTHDLASAGREVSRLMASRHPQLSADALKALAWTFTFSMR